VLLPLLTSVRFSSTQTPAAKASSLLDALPGNSLVSKTGIVTLTAATAAAGISSELFVLNEEVVILGSFVVFLGYVSSLIRQPYAEWADGQIEVRCFFLAPFLSSCRDVGTRSSWRAGGQIRMGDAFLSYEVQTEADIQ
jgi:hypothetical protein